MSFTKTVTLPVSPDEAFALITDPERLRRWQTVSAVVDLRAGGQYRWTINPGHVAAGTYREVEPSQGQARPVAASSSGCPTERRPTRLRARPRSPRGR